MDYRERFSKRLVQLREQRGITQQELADKLEITRQSLSLYEKAERTINIELLAKIADFFDVSTDYLMGRTDVSSMNEDIQTVGKVTGLSENAINNIIELQTFPNSFKILDYFLEYKDDGGMHSIFQMANEMFKMKDKLLIEGKRVYNDNLLKDDHEKFKEAQNLLQNTIFDVILVSDKVHIFEEQVKRALYSPIFNYGKSLGIPGFEEDLENAHNNQEG